MTVGEAISRMSVLLQDEDDVAWPRDKKGRALLDELTRLARQQLFTEILWLQGIGGQGRYALPANLTRVIEMTYNGQSLRHASEASLRRVRETWEATRDVRPAWFTQDQQPMTTDADEATVRTVEVVPMPVVTGSDIGPVPGLPLLPPIEDNFVVFAAVNPQQSVAEDTALAVPDILGHILIYRAVAQLSQEPTDYRDIDKAMFFDQLASVILKGLLPT